MEISDVAHTLRIVTLGIIIFIFFHFLIQLLLRLLVRLVKLLVRHLHIEGEIGHAPVIQFHIRHSIAPVRMPAVDPVHFIRLLLDHGTVETAIDQVAPLVIEIEIIIGKYKIVFAGTVYICICGHTAVIPRFAVLDTASQPRLACQTAHIILLILLRGKMLAEKNGILSRIRLIAHQHQLTAVHILFAVRTVDDQIAADGAVFTDGQPRILDLRIFTVRIVLADRISAHILYLHIGGVIGIDKALGDLVVIDHLEIALVEFFLLAHIHQIRIIIVDGLV